MLALLTIVFEFFFIALYSLFIFSFFQEKKWRQIAELMSSSAFGITLEFLVVQYFNTYRYSPNFLFQLGSYPDNFPIVIGLCWGMIIFVSMKVSDTFNFPIWTRPLFDGLLALTIDLSMDTIAIRVEEGLWVWSTPLNNIINPISFYGVPFGNFVGWFLIVLTYSIVLRIARQIWRKDELTPSLALYLTIMPLFAYTLFGFVNGIYWPLFSILFGILSFSVEYRVVGSLIITLIVTILLQLYYYTRRRKEIVKRQSDILDITLYLSFHIIFLFFYLILNMVNEIPFVLILSIINVGVGLLIHRAIFDYSDLYIKKKISIWIDKLQI